MNFNTAKTLFEHTIKRTSGISAAVNRGMLDLINQKSIETTSQEVVTTLAEGRRVLLTSDWHLGHFNIIRFCDRPFSSVETMNEALLKLLGKVDPTDLLIVVGDVSMGNYDASLELIRRIPGRKLLVAGNHDFTRDGQCRLLHEHGLFSAVVPFLFWTGPQGRDVLVSHYPAVVPDRLEGRLPLMNYHGHLHEKTMPPSDCVKHMNVGWDVDYSLRLL